MDYLIAIYTGKKIYTMNIKPGETKTVGSSQTDSVLIEKYDLGVSYLVLACDAGGVRILSRQPMTFGDSQQTSNRVLSAGETIRLNEKISLAVFAARNPLNADISIQGFDELRLGRSYNKNDICLKDSNVSSRHAVLRRVNDKWTLSDLHSSNGTFLNGQLVLEDDQPAQNLNIFIAGYVFYIENNTLKFTNVPGDIEFSPDVVNALVPIASRPKPYPYFQRSPRIRTGTDKAEFEISSPPNTGTKPSITWSTILLPPIMMVGVMAGIAFFTGNFRMLVYSLPMSAVSIVVAVTNNRNNMKKWQSTHGLALEKYGEYLADIEHKITTEEGRYISSLSAASPGVIECMSIAQNVSRRLWERTPRDSDFMSVRVGTGTTGSNVRIKTPQAQLTLEENPFTKQVEAIVNRHRTLTGIPVTHSLLEYPVTGITGGRADILRTTWRIIMDIATHHSYEDVKIVCVYPEDERDKWEWLRWLPHVWDTKHQKRYMACSNRNKVPHVDDPNEEEKLIADNERRNGDASKMLREIGEQMRARSREQKPSGKDNPPKTPFYVLILADHRLIEESGEHLIPESSSIGFAAIYAYEDIRDLPGECQSVITCEKNSSSIQNSSPDRGSHTVDFDPDNVSVKQMNDFARALAPVHILSAGGGSRMPTSVTFLQGFKAGTIDALKVIDKWGNSHSEKSLAAEIGIKENGDVFKFDVFEKAMGVHGIAAGTTGSGKSEMLTTWLLSMALNFSPNDVNFALIEFKGNDLSNILHTLPHIAGIIGNLNDSSTIMRGLKSLGGEKDRRARLFEECAFLSSKSIFAYQAYQKSHPEANLEPLPYLLIIIDEFAELMQQYPEFNEEVMSIARVGRSYGMFLTLTMQNPNGVVKDQVASNTRYRLCLRAASDAASKELIGTTDAYGSLPPGRAYVKVGNFDVYEQVQTFYAKAPYRPNSSAQVAVDEIKLVSLSGARTKPQIYNRTVKARKDEESEGNLIVKYIVDEAKKHGFKPARHVWTEPLPEILELEGLLDGKEAFDRMTDTWEAKNDGLSFPVGMIDDPSHQKQYPFVLDFMKNGHQILFAAPSSGKTTFLQTVITSAALMYTPEQVNFVVFDYGSFILKTFEALPHTVIVADPTDEDKVKKAGDFLSNELAVRRKLFSAEGVANLESYRQSSGKPMPAIIVVVDNFASLNNQSERTVGVLNLVARDGGGLGIYLMMTAGNNSGLYKIEPYVKAKHTLQLTDRTDYKLMVGGDGKTYPSNHPGRGLTTGALEYQTALCIKGDNEADRSKKLRELCKTMGGTWQGKSASLEKAEAAAAAPVEAGDLTSNANMVQLGLKMKTREPVEFVFSEMNGCIITGAASSGKSSILGMIAVALDKDTNTKLYVYEEKSFIEGLCKNAHVMHTVEDFDKTVAELEGEYNSRDDESTGRIVICIDNLYNIYQDMSQESADILEAIASDGASRGMYIYVSVSAKGLNQLKGWNVPLLTKLVNGGNAVITGGTLKDYPALSAMHREENTLFGSHEGCIIHDGKASMMMFGQPEASEKEGD